MLLLRTIHANFDRKEASITISIALFRHVVSCREAHVRLEHPFFRRGESTRKAWRAWSIMTVVSHWHHDMQKKMLFLMVKEE